MSDIFVATETFAVDLDGADTMVHNGITRVRDGHPLLSLRPESFKRVEDGVHFDVEDARGGPNGKRSGKRGLKVGTTGVPRDPRGISEDETDRDGAGDDADVPTKKAGKGAIHQSKGE